VKRTPTVFPIEEQSPTSLAADATHLYWTNYNEWTDPPRPYPDGGGAVKRVRRPQ
jgi:hypothetical protein